jgi:hypothetical protein
VGDDFIKDLLFRSCHIVAFLPVIVSSYRKNVFLCHSHAVVVKSSHSHQRAAHIIQLVGVVGKVARKPPPPPERFLVHLGCNRMGTAGDDDAPADCRARKGMPCIVHWRQWRPPLAIFIQSQHLARPCGPGIVVPTSKGGKPAVTQHAPSAAAPPGTHGRQIPPLPASLIRRSLFGRLQNMSRSIQAATEDLPNANDAPAWQARSRTTREMPVMRKERRLRSAPHSRQVNLVHRQ